MTHHQHVSLTLYIPIQNFTSFSVVLYFLFSHPICTSKYSFSPNSWFVNNGNWCDPSDGLGWDFVNAVIWLIANHISALFDWQPTLSVHYLTDSQHCQCSYLTDSQYCQEHFSVNYLTDSQPCQCIIWLIANLIRAVIWLEANLVCNYMTDSQKYQCNYLTGSHLCQCNCLISSHPCQPV